MKKKRGSNATDAAGRNHGRGGLLVLRIFLVHLAWADGLQTGDGIGTRAKKRRPNRSDTCIPPISLERLAQKKEANASKQSIILFDKKKKRAKTKRKELCGPRREAQVCAGTNKFLWRRGGSQDVISARCKRPKAVGFLTWPRRAFSLFFLLSKEKTPKKCAFAGGQARPRREERRPKGGRHLCRARGLHQKLGAVARQNGALWKKEGRDRNGNR
ncbi:phosphatidylinositol phosphate kinase motif-containing protein [Pandoravirus inopinatum]|uniref:Phosphatidylinositol phosphate kinase motif-containing protein n=1 Tax=Pandoravirus inopinatum TaxID=1605721 RepID=A0A0B5JB21_9VIRU|nr:phosphatidylinositol phosphate kinase motif-containing protein [Pandoravirus inopinatum]AJF98171.1 phosphatidylinositol phosphate kinase motif-containing protein [Pandoravirus inopinatum]